jgi:hypothetical protein
MSKADAPTVAKLLRGTRSGVDCAATIFYRAKAYSRAADSLAALAVPLDRLVEDGRLAEIPGVGDAIADIVTKLHRTGNHPGLRSSGRDPFRRSRDADSAGPPRGDIARRAWWVSNMEPASPPVVQSGPDRRGTP